MTATVGAATPGRARSTAGWALWLGMVMATLTEAVAGTALSLGRDAVIGDTHATADEVAWLDFGYLALKMIGFVLTPWLIGRFNPRTLVIAATLGMGISSASAGLMAQLEPLVLLRMAQGFCGGVLLVAGQAAVFLAYPRARQPLLQACFAMGAVVASAAVAPVLEGWLLDSYAWNWIFFSILPLALAATGVLLIADEPPSLTGARNTFEWLGALLVSTSIFAGTYVLTQGSRWDWFEEPHIVWLTVLAATALLAFLARQVFAGAGSLLRFDPFQVEDFSFAFAVSFVAGAALFGSAFVIPAFARAALALTYSDIGILLLPGGALFSLSLLVAGVVMQFWRVPPIATVPFGILMIMAAMWMLSGTAKESGAADMTAAILLRGFGLGFLFLSITLTAFMKLDSRSLASGIALFNLGRQLGGLIGVAVLETLIDHHVAGNVSVLGANIDPGMPAVAERLGLLRTLAMEHGMEATVAARVAMALLDHGLIGEATVIAFNAAFNAVAILFVFAVPCLIAIKITLHRVGHAAAARNRPKVAAVGGIPVDLPHVRDFSGREAAE